MDKCNFEYTTHFRVTRMNRVSTQFQSSGNRMKWFLNGNFIKLDVFGYESIAEYLASRLLQCTDLSSDEYVIYNLCDVYEDDKYLGHGCYSKDYRLGYAEVTFRKLLEHNLLPLSISYEELLDFLYYVTKLNLSSYIQKVLCLDSIIRNDDRHFGNFAVLKTQDDYKECPIFDNGGGCMSDIYSYPMTERFSSNYSSIYAKPFKVIFKNQIYGAPMLTIDTKKFFSGIYYPNKFVLRAVDTIKSGLSEMEGVAWKEK